MANGPILKRGPVKAPVHKKNPALKYGGIALHAIGGTPERRKLLAGVLGFLALSGGGWYGINEWRVNCAADEAAETQAADEKEKRETPVDQFIFTAKVQMVGGKPKVRYSRKNLGVDQCSTSEEHALEVNIGQLVDAGDGFWKFRISIEGKTHGKSVKYEVTEEVFADGAEREYELTARRVDSVQ